jgi:glycosyltransferase involved in cell wall biosynthesis
MNTPKITILIANYNNGHFFTDCFNSLITQTEQNWEAIVIDDCSTDNSVDIIKNLIKEDKRFRFYVNEKNIGYQKTLIRGIELSNAAVFGRLDPDDALKPNAIEVSIKTHEENPNAGLVYSNFIFCDKDLKENKIFECTPIKNQDYNFLNFDATISHFATFKKKYYQLTTGIDPFIKRAEDQDIYMKMCEVAPVVHINEALYLYRVHAGGVSTNDNSEKALFWHWVALIKMAERRGIEIEDIFIKYFVSINKYKHLQDKLNSLKNSRLLKILYKLGIFKAYKYL